MAGKQSKRSDMVYDELVNFLGDRLFQVPVKSFMDEHCIVFGPNLNEICDEHKKEFEKYKQIVDMLLMAFCTESGITVAQAIEGINAMSSVPDLKEVFNVLFEQVMMADNFDLFCRVMTKHNIMIQQQVIAFIIQTTGKAPTSFMPSKEGAMKGEEPTPAPVALAGAITDDKQEQEILAQVLQKSQDEHATQVASKQKEEADLEKTLTQSHREYTMLQRERTKLEEDITKMSLQDKPPPANKKVSEPVPAKSTPKAESSKPSAALQPPSVGVSSSSSSSDAAKAWLSSAKEEASGAAGATGTATAASMSGMSKEEMAKRQDFLKQQRDKLLAMKKDAREKQLGVATKANPGRPQSARAARSAMSHQQVTPSEDDQKRMAMRKAIAEKLRAEVIRK